VRIPFTQAQFFDVFAAYNAAVWPAQIVLYLAGLAVLVLAFRRSRWADHLIAAILAFYWLCMGALYHILFFRRINPAALIFGMVFIVQGVLFIIATMRGRLRFGAPRRWRAIVGAVFITYAMVIYPILGIVSGHDLLDGPLFGVAPCPTTIFTFGILLWAIAGIPWYTLIIPLLWSLVGFSAAVNLGVPQDYGLVVAGILGTVLIAIPRRNRDRVSTEDETHLKETV
jgi:hypothetical protein